MDAPEGPPPPPPKISLRIWTDLRIDPDQGWGQLPPTAPPVATLMVR